MVVQVDLGLALLRRVDSARLLLRRLLLGLLRLGWLRLALRRLCLLLRRLAGGPRHCSTRLADHAAQRIALPG